jgi:hypothetical protein
MRTAYLVPREIGSCFLMSIVLVAMDLGCSHTREAPRLTCIPQVAGAKAGYEAATIARQYLGAELTEAESGNDRAARIETEMFEGSQGRQIIAVVHHSHYCGSGGCLTFVLALNESQRWVPIWQALSEGIAIVPSENGRCDIRVANSRGGERLLRWQGEEYREALP